MPIGIDYKPNLVTYGSAIQGAAKSSEMNKQLAMLAQLLQGGRSLDLQQGKQGQDYELANKMRALQQMQIEMQNAQQTRGYDLQGQQQENQFRLGKMQLPNIDPNTGTWRQPTPNYSGYQTSNLAW